MNLKVIPRAHTKKAHIHTKAKNSDVCLTLVLVGSRQEWSLEAGGSLPSLVLVQK